MPDLPTRGRCHAIFLLVHSAKLKKCVDKEAWIRAAADKTTFMASSVDLPGTANLLEVAGLVKIEESVTIAPSLSDFGEQADLGTFIGIAMQLLCKRPPDWLRAVVVEGHLKKEFIPREDFKAISWLGNDMEEIILAAHQQVYGRKNLMLRKALGDAGELAVMSALQNGGFNPRHVSLISDSLGYDIELNAGGVIQGIEVKAAVEATAHRAFLSRNEFETAKRMKKSWKLIQVVFSSNVIVQRIATASDLVILREVTSPTLVNLAPIEKDEFKWVKTAELRLRETDWIASRLEVGGDFEAPLQS